MTDERPDMPSNETPLNEIGVAPAGAEGDLSVSVQSPTTLPNLGWKDLAVAVGIIWALELGLAFLTLAILFAVSGFNPSSLSLHGEYFLPAVAFSWSGALFVMWYFGCHKYRRPLRETFALRRVSRRTLIYSACGGLGCAVIGGIFMMIFSTGEGKIAELVFEPPAEEGGKPTISLAFIAIALALPLLEEVYYRGFLYGALHRLLGMPLAVTIVIVWFGLVHAPQLAGDWAGMIPITLMGGVFTVLRQWQGSIFPSIVAHVSYNLVLVMISIIGLAVM